MENSSLHHLHKNDKNGGYTRRRSRQFPEISVLSPRFYRAVAESTYLMVSSTFFGQSWAKIITKYLAIFQLSRLELKKETNQVILSKGKQSVVDFGHFFANKGVKIEKVGPEFFKLQSVSILAI